MQNETKITDNLVISLVDKMIMSPWSSNLRGKRLKFHIINLNCGLDRYMRDSGMKKWTGIAGEKWTQEFGSRFTPSKL